MHQGTQRDVDRRYQVVDVEKSTGATYTPSGLAAFVAKKIVHEFKFTDQSELSVLDPAIGDGELILALLSELRKLYSGSILVYGFDTDELAVERSRSRIVAVHPDVDLVISKRDFLEFVLDQETDENSLFASRRAALFDIIIANPPYVRTQILGAREAQRLAASFGLNGRVDLYQAFLLGMARVLTPHGTAGIIVSNRFMSTKGGAGLRAALRHQFSLKQIWDLGDTKLFSAAVLPAVIIANGTQIQSEGEPLFCSAYETTQPATMVAANPIDALEVEGVVELIDGRRFQIKKGTLDASGQMDSVWRIATDSGDIWSATVARHTWKSFGEIGKIRVGVKTCADKVFIRHDWEAEFGSETPELVRPLTTHHGAGRFRATIPKKLRSILYPHEVVQGQRRAVDLEAYPKSLAYLEANRAALESRTYVIEGGRRWYELWVPQDPAAWSGPKLVFRDISERPTFWIDMDNTVVNGDCYWMIPANPDDADLIWLAAAVANSTFIEAFYDHHFNNKLYAGRRRYITQYVEQFPLPDPKTEIALEISRRAREIYFKNHDSDVDRLESELNVLVWQSFGLSVEEV